MARNPRDTEEMSSDDGTVVDEVAAVRAELRRAERAIEARLRPLEAWRTALDGLPGHPGRFSLLDEKLLEVERDLEKQEASMITRLQTVEKRQEEDRHTIEALRGITWKIVVAACTSGAIVAFVLNVARWITK